jgi:TPR repeat protein
MERAFELYEDAASKGLSIAQYNLGSLYMEGIDTDSFKLPKNPRFAIEYWKMAAEQHLDFACLNLASYYFRGDGPQGVDKTLSRMYLDRIDVDKTSQKDVAVALRAQLQGNA